MRWSRFLAAVGVTAGASFATYDEALNLLVGCEVQSPQWYARLVVLAMLFLTYAAILAAGAAPILLYTGRSRKVLRRLIDIAVAIVVALAVAMALLIADPLLSYAASSVCSLLSVCTTGSFGSTLRHAFHLAADWPNTPVAVFMVTLFGMGAVLVQGVAEREATRQTLSEA
jgi:hypothetical protein